MRLPRHAHDHDDHDDYEDEAEETDENEGGRGGYLFTALPGEPPLTLAEPIAPRSARFSLSIPPERIAPGRHYLLGAPGSANFEVVQVEDEPARPGRPRAFRRALYGTVLAAHPAGTAVTAIRVERIDDWDRWSG